MEQLRTAETTVDMFKRGLVVPSIAVAVISTFSVQPFFTRDTAVSKNPIRRRRID
jgi:hypothetical protein